MYCHKCRKEREGKHFVKGILGICKECLQKEFDGYIDKDDIYNKIPFLLICRKYNIYYDDGLIESLEGQKFPLIKYLSEITLFPQYKGLHFKDSFNNIKENKLSEYFGDGKDDIDFIEKDIQTIKNYIINSLDKGDFNAHNKWMNNLRDALDLKNKLENKTDTYNTFNVNISKDMDINEFAEKLNYYIKNSVNNLK